MTGVVESEEDGPGGFKLDVARPVSMGGTQFCGWLKRSSSSL